MVKKILKAAILSLFLAVSGITAYAQNNKEVVVGAANIADYLPVLNGKKVAVFANQTSLVGSTHLVDTLQKSGVQIIKIFSPEHGFRGTADAGAYIKNSTDSATGLPIVSLYGSNRVPSAAQLSDVDMVIFDMQDVGVRFYTYISSLEEMLEATLVNNKTLLVLDRPNPNGFYIDGPVLEDGYSSFVGKQKVPIVYGMTIGEYAQMIAGEKWLNKTANEAYAKNKALLQVIACKAYNRKESYELPVKPSPNLPNLQSILLYPSLCFFEGTNVSLGRGTDFPFQIYGAPGLPNSLWNFTPKSVPGATNPPLKNTKCYGYDLSKELIDVSDKKWQKLQLGYLLNAYKLYPSKNSFFLTAGKSNPKPSDYFFNKLAGNKQLMFQVMNDKTEDEIRESWQKDLDAFKHIRKKYLLYADF